MTKKPVRFGMLAGALVLAVTSPSNPAFGQGEAPDAAAPDVTVFSFTDLGNYGSADGYVGYSVGTRSCNRGGTPLNWCDQGGGCAPGATTADHPVIAQNLFRLKDGRLEQVGMSWLKHGFLSTNSTTSGCTGSAGQSCQSPPFGSNQLGVGCTDPYGAGLNGGRPLGRRSEVDGTTGEYPFPPNSPGGPYAVYDQRLKVDTDDVDPAQNAGATYYAEAQYVAPDDAISGNALNNASHRQVTVGAAPNFNIALAGSFQEMQSAIYAWKLADPSVETSNADFCSSPVERFEVARKVVEVDPGVTWHYEYVVRNMNSDHGGGAFSVQFAPGTSVTNAGFHDVESHSGEPYSTTDWTVSADETAGNVRWSTESFAENQNANALRWATAYSFWFDAAAAPDSATHTVELFKPFPDLVVDAGADAGICVGDTVQIGTSAVAGQTYSWAPGGATTAQVQVSPLATTIYTVTTSDRCHSAEDSITVTVAEGPSAPTLSLPADGAVFVSSLVSLEWSAVLNATSYRVEVATDAAFADVVVDEESATTNLALPPLVGGTYHWRVRASDGCWSTASAAFSFTIDPDIFSDGFESGTTNAWTAPPGP